MQTRSVRLIAVDLSQWDPSQETLDQLLDLLDEPSATRINRFRHRSDALNSLVGRLLPIYILQLTIHERSSIEFRLGSHGRPYLAAPLLNPPFDYNISHDGPWVVGAFTFEGRVGVDTMSLGLPDGIDSTSDLREALCDQLSPSERTRSSLLKSKYSAQTEREEEEEERIHLLRLWMYKESLSKLVGLGSSLPFSYLSFDLSPPYDLSSSNSTLSQPATKILKIHESLSDKFPPLSEMMFCEVQLPITPFQRYPTGVVLTINSTPGLLDASRGGDNSLELIEIKQIVNDVLRFRNGSQTYKTRAQEQ